ncbi:hepatic lectin-like [Pogoniulus pusillus]|uniref:hepatic lectin-like n=1 Tax=Pogoniulus pusillus TaxID=488313 RepID=UPI0030B93083
MAGQETYGNWLGPPGATSKRLVRHGGIYSVAAKASPGDDFRAASPGSSEDDYDDVSMAEPQQGHRMASEELQPQGASDLYILAGKPAAAKPMSQEGEPQPGGGHRRRVPSVAILYILVALSFVVWVLLFALAVVKHMEIMEELKLLRLNQAQARQEVAEARQEQARLRAVRHRYYEELQDMAALICRSFMDYRKCSGGWKLFGKSCYSFSSQAMSWQDAKETCTDLGAHLVIVDSEEEQTFLVENINSSSSSYWLGVTDQEKEGIWVWTNGNRPTISYWNTWERSAERERRDCGSIGADGVWTQRVCSEPCLWICEKPRSC